MLPDPYSQVVGQFAGDPRRVGMYLQGTKGGGEGGRGALFRVYV